MRISRRHWLVGFGGATLFGIVGFGASKRWLAGQSPLLGEWRGFSDDDVALLTDLAEAILPETDTPGARAAGVGEFIAIAVTECYDADRQAVVVAGLDELSGRAYRDHGRNFRALTGDEQLTLLSAIRGEQQGREVWDRVGRGLRRLARRAGVPVWVAPPTPHYFTLLVELAVLGYCTSQIGATTALRHQSIPGSYDGALPYRRGDRAWSI